MNTRVGGLTGWQDCFLRPFIRKTRAIAHLSQSECFLQLAQDKVTLLHPVGDPSHLPASILSAHAEPTCISRGRLTSWAENPSTHIYRCMHTVLKGYGLNSSTVFHPQEVRSHQPDLEHHMGFPEEILLWNSHRVSWSVPPFGWRWSQLFLLVRCTWLHAYLPFAPSLTLNKEHRMCSQFVHVVSAINGRRNLSGGTI